MVSAILESEALRAQPHLVKLRRIMKPGAMRLAAASVLAAGLAFAVPAKPAFAGHDWVGPAIVGAFVGAAIAHHGYRHHHRYHRHYGKYPYRHVRKRRHHRHYHSRYHHHRPPAVVFAVPGFAIGIGPHW